MCISISLRVKPRTILENYVLNTNGMGKMHLPVLRLAKVPWLIIIIIIIIIITISCMQGIYTYIPETNYVPRE